jgi:signal transduction histidine kinase
LNYSKLVRGEIALAPVNLDTLIRDIIKEYPAYQNSGGKIHIDGSLPTVLGNEALLTQCLSNLLGNAFKFVKKDQSPEVRLWAQTEGKFVRLWVEDNGIGIDPGHHERIFKVFERIHAPHEYPGTGIGLAIARKAAERMGGQIGVESKPGHGSKFWMSLPKA